MGAAGALAAGTAVFGRLPLASAAPRRTTMSFDDLSAFAMAMHVHSSFSEQEGSMDSQLFQAASNAVDVLWWTDHDFRMTGRGYRRTVHFTSLTSESGASGEGGAWTWQRRTKGSLATSGGGIVASPASPLDPVAGTSLRVKAKSTGTAAASFGFFGDCHPGGDNYRDNLMGQRLSIEVYPASTGSRGYLELLISSSYHQASGGRPAGEYLLSYRFGPPNVPASRTAMGLLGVVTIPLTPNGWNSVVLAPMDDIAALWPDMDARDFALWGLTLSAVSTGDQVTGYFDFLRFDRTTSGAVQLAAQQDMAARLAATYPSVTQRQGLEVSAMLPHVNWFGGGVSLPDYGKTTFATYAPFLQNVVIPQIHAAGGLASYNHPFGYGGSAALPVAQQDSLLAPLAAKLLANQALGADLLEVGYNVRSGVDLAHHVALWDVLSRNAVFVTANGTNDDHFGQNWRGITNNWFTSTWASSTAESDLLASLAAGRAWCASLSRYRGSLDLTADGEATMGSVTVSSVPTRMVTVAATDVPLGGSLELVQGAVDYAGAAAPAPSSSVVATYPADALAGGAVVAAVDTSADSFVRTQVRGADGAVIALSNPVWLLRSPPRSGIPAARVR